MIATVENMQAAWDAYPPDERHTLTVVDGLGHEWSAHPADYWWARYGEELFDGTGRIVRKVSTYQPIELPEEVHELSESEDVEL